MTFPAPHVVGHHVFTGVGEDELGNDVETWAEPVDVNVIAWYASMLESLAGHTSRVESDIDLLIPPDSAISIHDKIILPGFEKPFRVMAIEDCCHGFHQWQPGNVAKLKQVTG
ncbi:hypothetical protein PBI_GAIA_7 [Mycobacterium phage Gaia]|uniref:Head-to-tail stopper n=1 Tax=Mycobacterium phage Gaia TaxID=1486472 RepID=A0A068F1K8_9CAUD|nr:head-tail adaptor [Mycobacterium phage Gaia]AID58827.1 hypothetical protein PBI_GAIA_7 [Mycobacterium phage Gaia]AYQ99949.1 head-to-tail stopper [Mycobacterium phage Nebkiss]